MPRAEVYDVPSGTTVYRRFKGRGGGVTPGPDPVVPGGTLVESKSIPIGAGGWVTGMEIAPDGKMMVRADVYGWYDRPAGGTGIWRQLATRDHVDEDFDLQVIGPNNGCSAVAFAPSNSSIRYAMWLDGIWKSVNNGDTFSRVLTCEVRSNDNIVKLAGPRIAVDPVQPNVVYAGTPRAGLQYSRNAGSTWTVVPTTTVPWSDTGGGVTAVAVDATSAARSDNRRAIVAAGTWNGGLYRSTDGGTSWSKISVDANFTSVRQMKYAGNGDLFVVAELTPGAGTETGTNRLWRYRSGTWTNLTPSSIVTSGRYLASVAIDPTMAGRIAIVCHGKSENEGTVWRSTNYGDSWTKLTRVNGIATDIPWMQKQVEIEKWLSIGMLQFDPLVSGKLWVSEGIGVWHADITGTNLQWNSASAGIEELVGNVVVSAPGQQGVVVGAWDRAIFKQPDPTGTTYPDEIEAGGDFSDCWHMDWAADNPALLVADITNHQSWSPIDSGYSTDFGETWTPFASRPFNSTRADVYDGVNRPFGAGQIVAGSSNNFVWIPRSAWNTTNDTSYIEAPHYTTNRGVTWSQCTFPVGTNNFSFAMEYHRRGIRIAADRVNLGTFYIVSDNAIVYRSTDGGANWTQVANATAMGMNDYVYDFQPRLKTPPGKAGHLYQSVGRRQNGSDPKSKEKGNPFKKSLDGGVTWTTVPGIGSPEAFGFGKPIAPSTYPTMYVVGWKDNTEYGIWYSTNPEAATPEWKAVPTTGVLGAFDQIYSIDGDKNIAGRVYASFAGYGFAVVDVLDPISNTQPLGYSGEPLTLSWSDEFNYEGLPDPTIWNHGEPGAGVTYSNTSNDAWVVIPATTSEYEVTGGVAKIKARKTQLAVDNNRQMTTAIMSTRGRKEDFTHGYVESRMKLPKGKSLWPAFWLLGNGSNSTPPPWPGTGEVDICEWFNGMGDVSKTHTDVPLMGMHNFGHWFAKGFNQGNNTPYEVLHTVTGTTDGTFQYTGTGWSDQGTHRQTATSGNYVEFRYYGAGVEITGYRGPDAGIFAYSLDGGTESTLDTYSSTVSTDSWFFYRGGGYGPHVLRIRNTGTKNASSSGTKIGIRRAIGGTGHESINGGSYPGNVSYTTARPWWEDGQFHTYTLKRTSTEMIVYVDGTPIYRSMPGQQVGWGAGPLPQKLYDTPMHIRFDVQVGRTARYYVPPGTPGEVILDGKSVVFEEGDLEIEYVRVWQIP